MSDQREGIDQSSRRGFLARAAAAGALLGALNGVIISKTRVPPMPSTTFFEPNRPVAHKRRSAVATVATSITSPRRTEVSGTGTSCARTSTGLAVSKSRTSTARIDALPMSTPTTVPLIFVPRIPRYSASPNSPR